MNCSLSYIVQECRDLKQLYKSELRIGDQIILETCNSVYMMRILGKDLYIVSGGWFDKNKPVPVDITVRGCTWGGSIIKTDIIAACGLHLEFGNKVVTSEIKRITHIPAFLEN